MPFHFPPLTKEFSWETAQALCQLAFASYQDEPWAGLDLGPEQRGLFFDWPETDTRATLLIEGKSAICSFRGTQGSKVFLAFSDTKYQKALEDLVIDASFFSGEFVGFSNVHVHQGFNSALVGIWEELFHKVRHEGLEKIAFTGHSLGGAVAILAAARARRFGWPVTCVYTFGSPRNGDTVFATKYNELLGDQTYRLVNCADLVPRLPSRDKATSRAVLDYLAKKTDWAFFKDKKTDELLLSFWDEISHQLDYSHVGKTLVLGVDPFHTDWAELEKLAPDATYISAFVDGKALSHTGYPELLSSLAAKGQTGRDLQFILAPPPT